MKLRRLTTLGITAFEHYIRELKSIGDLEIPYEMLTDATMSEPLPTDVEVINEIFESRHSAAKNLYETLGRSNLEKSDKDVGMWCWLTLFYFDQLCPKDKSKQRKPGEMARYIPNFTTYLRYYRHLLASPYFIYRTHASNPEIVKALLSNPVNTPGDLYEQIASRQELVGNRLFLELTNKLYIDPKTNRLKPGSSGKNEGSPRRLADVLGQFDRTFDLYAIYSDRMLEMLPKEFKKPRAEKKSSKKTTAE